MQKCSQLFLLITGSVDNVSNYDFANALLFLLDLTFHHRPQQYHCPHQLHQ